LTILSPQTSEAKKAKEKECFVLSPIGKEDSPIRKHANDLFDCILKPVVERNGYNIERADKIEESGIITHQIMERIVNADLIIAVLTDYNPNVFYELALCHVARKPFIQMIQKDQEIPFDTSHVRTIQYDLDIRSAQDTEVKLEKLIKQNLDGKMENPISVGLAHLKLRESDKPEDQIKAEIYDKLQGIDNKLDNRLGIIQNQLVRLASQGQSLSTPQYIDPFNKVKGNVISLQDFWTYSEEKKKESQDVKNAQKKKNSDKVDYI
jgi:hypothetical protein